MMPGSAQIRGLDAIGASAEGRALTIWHTLPPPKRPGSQARRRRRRLALTLQDEQGCVDAALAIRAAVSAAAPRRLLVVINPVSGRGRWAVWEVETWLGCYPLRGGARRRRILG